MKASPNYSGGLSEGKTLIGSSQSMQQLRGAIERCAQVDVPVVIFGEEGSGKELVARALHGASPRGNGPFIAINVGALRSSSLSDSQLFGHKKGAFTDAKEDSAGLIVASHGGTLFLDEIEFLLPEDQGRLLRVLQEKAVLPIGATKEVRADFRLVVSTKQKLNYLVEEGKLRSDFFHRISVLQITVAPLRHHKEDIPELLRHWNQVLTATGRPTVAESWDLIHFLKDQDWPGNVRQLENFFWKLVVDRPTCLEDFRLLMVGDDSIVIRKPYIESEVFRRTQYANQFFGCNDSLFSLSLKEYLIECERVYFAHHLNLDSRMAKVAERTKIGLSTVYKKMKTLGLRV